MREESKNYHQYSTVGFDMNISISFDWPHEDFSSFAEFCAAVHICKIYSLDGCTCVLGQLAIGSLVGVVSNGVGVTWLGNS